MKERSGMLIAELEKQSGIRRSTIHHYIRTGLLPQPYKTGQTMAYYDESHVRRLELIEKIKLDYIKNTKATRVPLDFILNKISEGYTLAKSQETTATRPKVKNGEKAQKKKEEIIEATLKLYAKRGYYLTNIREIAREVGISPPTFYYYFQDKRELFIEAIEYVMRKYRREMEEALAGEPDRAKRSIIMFRIFHAHYPQIGEILHQLRAAVAVGDPWAKERLAKLYREMTKEISRRIRESMSAGLIRQVDPELQAFFNVSIHETVMHLASVDDRYNINEILSFVSDMLFHAFLTDKGKEVFRVFDMSRDKS